MYIFVLQTNTYIMGYEIILETKIVIKNDTCKLKSITIAFLTSLVSIFQDYVSQVLLHYFQEYYRSQKLAELLSVKSVRLKTTNKLTKFKTIFGTIYVPQIQVRALGFDGIERQMSITRTLLEVSPKFQIPDFIKEMLGFISAQTTFRVGHKIVGLLTNFQCSLQSVWNSVKFAAGKIKLELAPDGTNEFEADGTGIPTKNSGKRGSELKKVFQKKVCGGLHLVGLSIGNYKLKEGWQRAFSQLKEALNSDLTKFAKIILSSDGDLSIINTAKNLSSRVKIQIDKWHVFHQMKYYLWQDGIKKELKYNIIAHFFKISMLSKRTIEDRNNRIARYINLLLYSGCKHTATYLQSVMPVFYTHETEGNENIYTSKTERSMRTTNQRINVGIWSEEGALNICKIRDAYYYNGISVLNWKKTA